MLRDKAAVTVRAHGGDTMTIESADRITGSLENFRKLNSLGTAAEVFRKLKTGILWANADKAQIVLITGTEKGTLLLETLNGESLTKGVDINAGSTGKIDF